jgi:hypothetical protein
MTQRIGTQSHGFPQTWLGRVVGGLLAAALLVAAFFFLFIFLLVLGVLILAVLLRLLWRAKKVRTQASKTYSKGSIRSNRKKKKHWTVQQRISHTR